MSQCVMMGSIAAAFDPAWRDGKVSGDLADGILNSAFGIEQILPHKDVLVAAFNPVLDANKTVQERGIWEARDVRLDASQKLTPVTVGIWDSGTDVKLYPNNLWTNTKEVADNKKDDDKDGYVDDVHGIAWTIHGDPSTELLFPITTAVS